MQINRKVEISNKCCKPRSHNGKDWGHWRGGIFTRCNKEHVKREEQMPCKSQEK